VLCIAIPVVLRSGSVLYWGGGGIRVRVLLTGFHFLHFVIHVILISTEFVHMVF
jgi:hypothetical protein